MKKQIADTLPYLLFYLQPFTKYLQRNTCTYVGTFTYLTSCSLYKLGPASSVKTRRRHYE